MMADLATELKSDHLKPLTREWKGKKELPETIKLKGAAQGESTEEGRVYQGFPAEVHGGQWTETSTKPPY